MSSTDNAPWSREEFLERLRHKGAGYHLYHPFQVMMNEGKMNREQMQGWVANRFYYQKILPMKDGAVMANCSDREMRREWILRILDQDGTQGNEGGIEAWIRLGEACGLRRAEIVSEEHAPGGAFCRRCPYQFCPHAPVAGGGLFFPHRALRTRCPLRASGGVSQALSVDCPGGSGLLS